MTVTELKAPERTEHQIQVQVTYNGLTKPLAVNLKEAVNAALEHALNLFQVTVNRHIMALFTAAGVELADNQSLQDQGVTEGVLLLLRPSTVKGG